MSRVPPTTKLQSRLRDGYALDELWGETMGLPAGDTKEKPLRLVAELLEREGVAYALIGGVAVQLHTEEPRTTRDIDLAVRAYSDVPRDALLQAGFQHTGRHDHSDNWLAPATGEHPQRTVVQFSAEEPVFVGAVERASLVDLGGLRLRLVTAADLILLKLAAAEAPRRRASKREHDIGDILALIEEQPELAPAIPDLAERLHRIRALKLDFEK
jgi:predicted nucleotidyltransferase